MISLLKPRNIRQLGGHHGWAAICFTESSLDLTTARGSGGNVGIENQASVPLPPAGEATDTKSRWRAAVSDLRQKINPHEHRIVTAVRAEDVLCQTLRLPSTQVEELRQMLDLQIDNLTPLPVEEMVYGFEPLETTNSETLVLVAVASKAVVNERVQVLEAAGLPPEVVGIDEVAVFRSFLRNQMLPVDEKLNTFVQITPTAASIIVHTRGVPVAIRSVVLGDASLRSVEGQTALREELQRTLVAAEAEQPGRHFGMLASAHMAKYGTTKEQLGKVRVKSAIYGELNEKAIYRKKISLEDVLSSEMVTTPLKKLDCCANADGAAVVILASYEVAKKITDKPVWILGLGGSTRSNALAVQPSFTSVTVSREAVQAAYEMAGVGPEDIDVAQVHDCFTIAEIVAYEDCGFAKPGEGSRLIDEKQTYLGGKIPVNLDGGLLSKGHPIGATGVSQIRTIVKQLRGEAGKTQVEGARIGLVHNLGGPGVYGYMTILGRD